ncbi:MAG: hypothetical protein P8P74_07670 [Crocinitomicaceae bacterium]|nr:hypothetical protein [Crocinitomicaceae bacterium]
MKNLLFCLLLSPTWLQAQTYVPFISTTDSSDTWMDMNSCQDFSCFFSYTNRYAIEGDTTIGSFQYSKVYIKYKYEEGTVTSQWCNESVSYGEYYYGAIRESGKQVFLIQGGAPDSSEYLAYDFNLSIGDTLPSPDGNPFADPDGRIISVIDSVLVFGNYRKRYVVDNYKYLIEGIGSSTGLFNALVYNQSECYNGMRCYAEYQSPDHFLQDCNMNLNVDSIEGSAEPPVLVKIIDYMGRETSAIPNTPLIYIYSDGTTKKVFHFE